MSYWKIIAPEASTNLILNPSLETNDTGWTQGTNWTLTRSTTRAKFGVVSALLTSSASPNQTVLTYALTLPTQSTTYTISAWVYVPAGYDGGNVRLSTTGYTSATTTILTQWVDGTDDHDKWHYLSSTVDVLTDVAGSITLYLLSVPTSGKTLHLDGLQVEQKSYATTYIDGDLAGCFWRAGKHASESHRPVTSWQGGRIRDLVDDLSIHIEGHTGLGDMTYQAASVPYSLQGGAAYQRSRATSRFWSLMCVVNGNSIQNMHTTKNALLDILAPTRLGSNNAPVLFQYTGNTETREWAGVYTGGSQGQIAGYYNRFPLRFVSHDPAFYQVGETGIILDSEDSATMQLVAARLDGVWDTLGPPDAAGTYNDAYDLVPRGNEIFVVGNFTNFDNDADADYVAAYDRSAGTWSPVGTGLNGTAYRGKLGPDGKLYVGGGFTTAGGTTVRGIASWDGSTWAALGPPSSGSNVFDFAWDHAGNLWVVGNFTNWDGIANADYVVYWDGSAWAAPAVGANGIAYSIDVDRGGKVWIGGAFTSIGGVTVDGIAYWDGSVYTRPGSDSLAEVRAVYAANDGKVWIGGNFTDKFYYWNGSAWIAPDDLPNSTVNRIVPDGNGNVFVVGNFTSAGNYSLSDGVALFDGSAWTPLDIDTPGVTQVESVLIAGERDIYLATGVTGTATYAGHETVTNEGNAISYPVIRIFRSGGTAVTLKSIRNNTTGKELHLNTVMLDGETWEIDLRRDVYRMRSSFSGQRWQILPQSDAAEFALVPGENDISVFFTKSGSPTVVSWMIWRNAWRGLD